MTKQQERRLNYLSRVISRRKEISTTDIHEYQSLCELLADNSTQEQETGNRIYRQFGR